ncbi:hypothetical protein [Streptomyces beihaiensis]|uniref:Lipoprotein n=1 Tax=Streptomyces beihaiensis TaxID=2984495 RepID=A0ABT3U0H4_9ACTN|nr:hypothetical protein [Streptomyces beihaiensis]MCX3062816.1 hypothetical protein [Streptomyces beihaiensis]
MVRRGIRVVAAAALTATVALGEAGCSDGSGTSPSGAASKAASFASSAASKGAAVAASATAEAKRRLDAFKGRADAKGDVKTGAVKKDADGRATTEVTATNGTAATASYAVEVDFRDSGGNLLDAVVVTVDGVEAGASKKATARSNRALGGHVTADVARALRN